MVFEIVSIGDGLRYRNFTPAMGGYRPVILTLGSSTDGDCFMKRPSFQFYPSDWLRDTALRTCSVSARGLWIDMICYMHEGTPYGYLKVNDKVILPSNLAAMCGATLENVEGWLKELETAGVFKRDENGVIHSKRMIRDEEIRNSRASGGKLGGNPALLKVGKVNHKVQNKDKPNPTPSSSSSSTSSKSRAQSRGTRLPADWVPAEDQISFCKLERPDLNPKAVVDRFKDFWVAQPGSKGVKLDWDATWRNWVRSEKAVGSSKAAASNSAPDWAPKRARSA